jgi:hypothetical protein
MTTIKGANMSRQSFPRFVDNGGKYFLDHNRKPFFWLGDTGWKLFCGPNAEAAESYFATRSRQGFTVIQCVLAWPDFRNSAAKKPPVPNFRGELPWHNCNPATPNEKYFSHIDLLLRSAQDKGLTFALLPCWGQFLTDEQYVNMGNAYTYGKWLGTRYRNQPNIVWILGGDTNPQGFEQVFDSLAGGLRDGDGGSHLITYHPVGWGSSSQFFHSRPWLDFNLVQTWSYWDRCHEACITDLLLRPTKPVLIGEGAYEQEPGYPCGAITPVMVRRQAWWTFMAGGHYTYGHHDIYGCRENWLSHLEDPAATHMSIFQSIARSYPWWDAVSDQGIIETGRQADQTLNTAIRAVDHSWAMVYLSSHTHVVVRLGKMAPEKVKATWINPQNNERRDAGRHVAYTLPGYRGVRTTTFALFSDPDVWEDAVLVIEGE